MITGELKSQIDKVWEAFWTSLWRNIEQSKSYVAADTVYGYHHKLLKCKRNYRPCDVI